MRSNLNLEVLVYVGASFLFLYLFLSLPLYLLIQVLYLLISSFLYFLFLRSFFVSFFLLFSIFLEPEPKLFHVTWVNKLHWHFIFYMVSYGKSKQHRQIRCPGFFWLFRCSGVFWGVPEWSKLFRCSCVPGFSTCHSFNHFWQCVTKSYKVTIACQTN